MSGQNHIFSTYDLRFSTVYMLPFYGTKRLHAEMLIYYLTFNSLQNGVEGRCVRVQCGKNTSGWDVDIKFVPQPSTLLSNQWRYNSDFERKENQYCYVTTS
jgi:hypothetical protein